MRFARPMALRNACAMPGPRHIAEFLMTTAEEWSGSPEQADDMTVIVARLGS